LSLFQILRSYKWYRFWFHLNFFFFGGGFQVGIMPVDLDNSSTASGEASVSSSGNQPPPPPPPQQPPSKSAATAKKKRNLPGMPGKESVNFNKIWNLIGFWLVKVNWFFFLISCRSRSRGDSLIAKDPFSYKSICMWNMQQRVSKRPKLATSSTRT